ncbi:MAG: tyrosine-type recombinase/integrase [Defluviitaleaceae bacterium]|nr:tyrosine-type recombinase/integrase [Defluviitaleaceae bacterium]
MSTTQPIRNLDHVRALANYYMDKGELRNYRLIVLSLHTALRVSDLLSLRWSDVYDFKLNRPCKEFTLTEQKTGKSKTVAINHHAAKALKKGADTAAPYHFLFANAHSGKALVRAQAYRIIRNAGEALELPGRISCHSLRKTFGYHAWKKGISPAVIMEIYNHSSLSQTRRYLGINQDDLNTVYMSMAF